MENSIPRVVASAVFSDCQKYRYSLCRIWDDSKGRVLFIMLNPSTADGQTDDPTIRRCIAYAKAWGYGGLYVVNLFAFCATNPKDLLDEADPIGKDNLMWIRRMSSLAHLIICAWGNGPIVAKLHKALWPEYKPLMPIEKPLYYLELAKDGTPKHPLYLRNNVKPQQYPLVEKL